jgi:hypothetical protein
MGNRIIHLALCVSAGIIAMCDLCARGQTFTRFANTSTSIPGGTDNFTSFDPLPSQGGSGALFRGFGAGGQEGIYSASFDGLIQRIADRKTLEPSGGPFVHFFTPADGDSFRSFFTASTAANSGIYSVNNGTIIAWDRSPLGTASYTRTASHGELVAYRRDGVVYSNRSGTLSAEFFNVGLINPAVGAPDIVGIGVGSASIPAIAVRGDFTTTSARSAIFRRVGNGPIQMLFETDGGMLGEVSLGFDGAVAVIDRQAGIKVRHELVTFWPDDVAVHFGDPIPGGTGGFTDFTAIATGTPQAGSGTVAAFVGEGSGDQHGLFLVGYTSMTPWLVPLVSRGQVLDGRIVETLSLGRDAIRGNNMAFHATFADGTSGIYRADLFRIPEPASLGPIALGMLLGGRWR